MKRLFYFLACVIMLSICSCNMKDRSQEYAMERARLDSLEKDSIAKAQALTDSLSLIAWGDTKFGMTKQEVMASKAFEGEKEKVNESGQDWYYMDYSKRSDLRKLYKLSKVPTIIAYFKENELFQVSIESTYGYASDIEDLANDCGIFTKEFMKKYGEPDYLRTSVSILDFKQHEAAIATFKIGDKSIWIGLNERDSEYAYGVYIRNNTFPKKQHVPTEEEIKKQKEKEAKDKELRESSF